MNEAGAMIPQATYSSLIHSVFIDPIRTVTVVDDEYPTLGDFLLNGKDIEPKKQSNISKVRDILDLCRSPERSWLVDVHDGGIPDHEFASARHLHHSDLMILDYHLDPLSLQGEKSIKILRELAESSHFNLVVVYTAAGDGIGGDIDQTIAEIALGLSIQNDNLKLKDNLFQRIQNSIDEWGDYDPSAENKIMSQVDLLTFLRLKSTNDPKFRSALASAEFEVFKEIVAASSSFGLNLAPEMVLKWAYHKSQLEYAASFSPKNFGPVSFGMLDGSINWIRTNTLFVTVVSKGSVEPKELPNRLAKALEAWEPLPQRLILSKMRAELDATGVLLEDAVLSDRHLQAGWLEEFLGEAESDVAGGATVDRHWESLGDAVRPRVAGFAENLAKSLALLGCDRNHCFEGLPTLDVLQESHLIHLRMNRYACSKRIDGRHLSVGQIFEFKEGTDIGTYWVCLSPACDLVPGQKKDSGWGKRLASWVPFKAVRLFPASEADALKEASRANHVFVEIGGSLKTFAFVPPSENGSAALANPKWEQMFARNDGRLDGSDRSLTISRLEANSTDGIVSHKEQAQVVAQLRYEYALNLLQRLGANLSRIGLDFKSFEPNIEP